MEDELDINQQDNVLIDDQEYNTHSIQRDSNVSDVTYASESNFLDEETLLDSERLHITGNNTNTNNSEDGNKQINNDTLESESTCVFDSSSILDGRLDSDSRIFDEVDHHCSTSTGIMVDEEGVPVGDFGTEYASLNDDMGVDEADAYTENQESEAEGSRIGETINDGEIYPCHPAPPLEVKLFIGKIPRTFGEEDIKPLFEQYGKVVSVSVIRDKNNSAHKGSAFVRMACLAQADAAVRALNNQKIIDETLGPLQVKYATGEAEKLGISDSSGNDAGLDQAKLFIGSLPKNMSEEEVRSFFGPYGQIDEIFIMKDSANGAGKGCAFVKYAFKEQAIHAVKCLDKKHTFEGCSRPIEVRFAESRLQRQQPPTAVPATIPPVLRSTAPVTAVNVVGSPVTSTVSVVGGVGGGTGAVSGGGIVAAGSVSGTVANSVGTVGGVVGTGVASVTSGMGGVVGSGIGTVTASSAVVANPAASTVGYVGVPSAAAAGIMTPYGAVGSPGAIGSPYGSLTPQYLAAAGAVGVAGGVIGSTAMGIGVGALGVGTGSNSAPRQAGHWKEYFNTEGRPYYHNEITNVTQWDKPPDFDQQAMLRVAGVGGAAGVVGAGGVAGAGVLGGSAAGGVAGAAALQSLMAPNIAAAAAAAAYYPAIANAMLGKAAMPSSALAAAGALFPGGAAGAGAMMRSGAGTVAIQGPVSQDIATGPTGANIFVFHVPPEWTQTDLLAAFSPFGKVISARIATDKSADNKTKGYAFVSYDNIHSAAAAVNHMTGFVWGGKKLKVSIKKGEEHAVQHLLTASAIGTNPITSSSTATAAYVAADAYTLAMAAGAISGLGSAGAASGVGVSGVPNVGGSAVGGVASGSVATGTVGSGVNGNGVPAAVTGSISASAVCDASGGNVGAVDSLNLAALQAGNPAALASQYGSFQQGLAKYNLQAAAAAAQLGAYGLARYAPY